MPDPINLREIEAFCEWGEPELDGARLDLESVRALVAAVRSIRDAYSPETMTFGLAQLVDAGREIIVNFTDEEPDHD